MKNNLIHLIGAALCAAFALNANLQAADSAGSPPAAAPAKETKIARQYPFRGTVGSVNAEAGTITLDGRKNDRMIKVGPDSVLEKDGQPVKLAEVAKGHYLKGLLLKDADGKEVVVKATVGPKPSKESPETASAGQ